MNRACSSVVIGVVVSALAACVGGPGPLPGEEQGQDQGSSVDDGAPPRATPSGGEGSVGEGGDSVGSSTISASDFDRSCAADADCLAVYEGSLCGCACPNAAIAAKDASEYASRAEDARKSCSSNETCVADCRAVSAKCSSGTCALEDK